MRHRPLVSVLDTMINVESICSQENISISVLGTHITIGDKKFDIHNIRSLLSSALRMFCCGHGVVLSKRKHFLRPFIDQKFHNLLKPTNPVTSELLGPDLEQKITESAKIADVGKKLATGFHHRHDRSNFFPPNSTTPHTYNPRGRSRLFRGNFRQNQRIKSHRFGPYRQGDSQRNFTRGQGQGLTNLKRGAPRSQTHWYRGNRY